MFYGGILGQPGAADAAGFAEFITPAHLGYARTEVPDGHRSHKKVLQINENEVQTVRLMYYMLLNGSSIMAIASILKEL